MCAQMSTGKWRDKHRKCTFCKHLYYLSLPPNCMGRNTYCLAKKKIVFDKIPRHFCKIFELETGD